MNELYDAKMKEAMSKLDRKFASIFKSPSLGLREDYRMTPRFKTSKEAAKILLGKKRIVFLTGAGINKSIGIPNPQKDKYI